MGFGMKRGICLSHARATVCCRSYKNLEFFSFVCFVFLQNMAGEIDSCAFGIIVRCLTFEISERTCSQLFSLDTVLSS